MDIEVTSKEEGLEICVNYFRSYELLAFTPCSTVSEADATKYIGMCAHSLQQYAQLAGLEGPRAAHMAFTSIH